MAKKHKRRRQPRHAPTSTALPSELAAQERHDTDYIEPATRRVRTDRGIYLPHHSHPDFTVRQESGSHQPDQVQSAVNVESNMHCATNETDPAQESRLYMAVFIYMLAGATWSRRHMYLPQIRSHEDSLWLIRVLNGVPSPMSSCILTHCLNLPAVRRFRKASGRLHFLIELVMHSSEYLTEPLQGHLDHDQIDTTENMIIEGILSRTYDILMKHLLEQSAGQCPLYYRSLWPVSPLGVGTIETKCLHILSAWHSRSPVACPISEEEVAPSHVQIAWCYAVYWSYHAAHTQLIALLKLMSQPMLISLRDNELVFLQRSLFLPLKCLPLVVQRSRCPSILEDRTIRKVNKLSTILPNTNLCFCRRSIW
jgi:hypothetical protein